MRRGTIMMETDAPTLSSGSALLRLDRAGGAQGMMSLQWVPSMGLVLLVTQRDDVFHATLPLSGSPSRLRLSFAWDLDHSIARIAAEDPLTNTAQFLTVDNPLPIFLSDFWSLSRGAEMVELGSGTRFIAVSEAVEPIGPMPTIDGDTLIDTPDGPRPMVALNKGDLVRTRDGEMVAIQQILRRIVPAAGSFHPLRVPAPAFGLEQDLRVAPAQRLVVSGHDVEHAFGTDTVSIAAQHLPGDWAVNDPVAQVGPLMTYYQVILENAEPVMCQGLALESLNLEPFQSDRHIIAHSLLASVGRSALPTHERASFPLLGPVETTSLVETRAA
jgi:hypothetical protein